MSRKHAEITEKGHPVQAGSLGKVPKTWSSVNNSSYLSLEFKGSWKTCSTKTENRDLPHLRRGWFKSLNLLIDTPLWKFKEYQHPFSQRNECAHTHTHTHTHTLSHALSGGQWTEPRWDCSRALLQKKPRGESSTGCVCGGDHTKNWHKASRTSYLTQYH